jgi:hypothetical protein
MAAPGPELLEESRFRRNEGPIGFALDVISQWNKELRFVLRFLHAMQAAPDYHPLEYMNTDGAVDTSQVPYPSANKREGGGRRMTARATAPPYSILSTCSPAQSSRRKVARLSVAYQSLLWDRHMTTRATASPGFHH